MDHGPCKAIGGGGFSGNGLDYYETKAKVEEDGSYNVYFILYQTFCTTIMLNLFVAVLNEHISVVKSREIPPLDMGYVYMALLLSHPCTQRLLVPAFRC